MTEASDFGPARNDGRTWRPVVVEDLAFGANRTMKRARRADALDYMTDVPGGHKLAARLFQRAAEHMRAGMGLGPVELDRADGAPMSSGPAPLYWGPQERALSAAECYRRGVQAIGSAGLPVVQWALIEGHGLAAYDAHRRWRRGTASGLFKGAVNALAHCYGYE